MFQLDGTYLSTFRPDSVIILRERGSPQHLAKTSKEKFHQVETREQCYLSSSTLAIMYMYMHAQAVSLATVAPSQPKSKDTATTPIKTRTEQQDKFVRALQASLSEKISEKVPVLDAPPSAENSEDLFDVSTPSVCSTVSSSGDVEGVYTLYSDEMTQSSEDEEETTGEVEVKRDEKEERDDFLHLLLCISCNVCLS